MAPTIADPPVGSPVGTIQIPKINLAMTVVEGTDEAQLAMGPGHYPTTPLPGQAGNAAIAGHRTTYLHPFYSLDALAPGDLIYITTLQGTFLYRVLQEPGGPAHRRRRGGSHTDTPAHAHHLQSALQRQPAPGGARPTWWPASWPTRRAPRWRRSSTTMRHRRRPRQPGGQGLAPGHPVGGAGGSPGHRGVDAGPPHPAGRRALAIVGGILVWLIVVFFFFQAVHATASGQLLSRAQVGVWMHWCRVSVGSRSGVCPARGSGVGVAASTEPESLVRAPWTRRQSPYTAE